jgi:hypothetical protein
VKAAIAANPKDLSEQPLNDSRSVQVGNSQKYANQKSGSAQPLRAGEGST